MLSNTFGVSFSIRVSYLPAREALRSNFCHERRRNISEQRSVALPWKPPLRRVGEEGRVIGDIVPVPF